MRRTCGATSYRHQAVWRCPCRPDQPGQAVARVSVPRRRPATLLCALSAGGVITVELLVLLSLALGVMAGLNQPARLALIPSLVAKDDIITAIAMS